MSLWLYVPIAAVVAVGLAVGGFNLWGGRAAAAPGTFVPVRPVVMDITVAKDGELQAVRNIDIHSRVEGRNTVQWVIAEGETVNRGDRLVVLDSALIRLALEDALLAVQNAEADLFNAQELLEIHRMQTAADLEADTVALELAQLELKQYEEGTYPQEWQNAKIALEMAGIRLTNKQNDLEQTESLASKGFVTPADVQRVRLEVQEADNALQRADQELKVLTEYKHPMTLTDKRSKLAQAEQRLTRTQRQAARTLAQRESDVQTREQTLVARQRRQEHFEAQLENCVIRAPSDGLVVYGSTGRRGQEPIQEGMQVHERQLLIRLPDTSAMKAVLSIQEAQVPRLKVGQRARVQIVGVPEPVDAELTRISVMADSGSRWWNPDLREYPVELTLDETPPGLRPGMGVQAEIFVHRLGEVTAVPLPAIYSVGRSSYVFVRQGGEIAARGVTIGQSNSTHVQVVEGLSIGEEVLLLESGQGRDLLERASGGG